MSKREVLKYLLEGTVDSSAEVLGDEAKDDEQNLDNSVASMSMFFHFSSFNHIRGCACFLHVQKMQLC